MVWYVMMGIGVFVEINVLVVSVVVFFLFVIFFVNFVMVLVVFWKLDLDLWIKCVCVK